MKNLIILFAIAFVGSTVGFLIPSESNNSKQQIQLGGGAGAVADVKCNVSTIITTPCICGCSDGPTCEVGRVCIDPTTTQTCTTPTICIDKAISTSLACTCGAAGAVCTAGQFCRAAMGTCTSLPDCVETGRYSMENPCRCGAGTYMCGLNATPVGEACTSATGQCTSLAACAPFQHVLTTPCLCGSMYGEVVCPAGAQCSGVTISDRCTITVPFTPSPHTGS